jgi:prepilin-type N-terminal cleavage/methylation domain-containing protein
MRRTFSRKKNGVTLIELLVCMAVLAMVSSVIFSIYYKCTHVTRKANDYIQVLHKVRNVSVMMRRDIRAASAVVSSIEGFVSDEDTLILKIPYPRETRKAYHVIYRFSREEDGGLKKIIVDNTMNRRVSHLLTKDALQEVRFNIDRTKVRPLVGVDLTFTQGVLKKGSQTIFSFSASLRNIRGKG